MFNGGHPVLYSSARAAITSALSELDLSRIDKVGLFPYASHCVLDSVSRIASPSCYSDSNSENIIYHQWGYIYNNPAICSKIEDAVDTLVCPGTDLFPMNGSFEIWSFPKIVGTTGGGVLWCRSVTIANKLRHIRDQKPHSDLLWLMRILGLKSYFIYTMWQGAEAFFGKPSTFLLSEIDAALDKWSEILNDRKLKLDLAWKHAPAWLDKPSRRLPSVVPIEINRPLDHSLLEKELLLSTTYRHFIRVLSTGCHEPVKVIPVPIHQGIKVSDLIAILEKITFLNRD
jgi:putative PLP-dependent aminotransferase (TIGR04422 family)